MKTRFLALTLLVILSVAAHAAITPVGKWHGHFKLAKELAKKVPEKNKAALKEAESAVVNLELKKDHTYSATEVFHKTKHVQNGTWSINGSIVTLLPISSDGKKVKAAHGEPLKLMPDGKTLVMPVPGGQVTFTR